MKKLKIILSASLLLLFYSCKKNKEITISYEVSANKKLTTVTYSGDGYYGKTKSLINDNYLSITGVKIRPGNYVQIKSNVAGTGGPYSQTLKIYVNGELAISETFSDYSATLKLETAKYKK